MLFNSSKFFQLSPNNGLAKVYHKNLLVILQNLEKLNPLLNKKEYLSHIIQANDLLIKLKKADEKFDCSLFELTSKQFEAAFYKTFEDK